MTQQKFIRANEGKWIELDFLPGVRLLPLAEPIKDGSIHKATLTKGTKIPAHTHPADEYVLVLSGTIETGGVKCEAGDFWITPKNVRQGPHLALTNVEIITVRLGLMGEFEKI